MAASPDHLRPDAGKLCTIVDVIDNNRVLVDGPEPITGVHRHALNIKRMQLTDFVIPAKLNASQKTLKGLWASEGIQSKGRRRARRERSARPPRHRQRL